MRNIHRSLKGRSLRLTAIALLGLALVTAVGLLGSVGVSANHPVLVEGNCDSPVPGTTLVAPGTCGDFDGDGRIGTAEDTDGADRIFGTITAALGPGTGAAAGTGANHNGKIIIVASGRYAETLYIGQNLLGPGAPGIADPGNVTIEAAPGVEATIDAVLQGDPAGGNNTRQGSTGILVVYTAPNRVVTLRNLEVRNFNIGIEGARDTKLHIDNCRVENNLNYGILGTDNTRIVISNTSVDGTGFRIGTSPFTVANPGNGIHAANSSSLRIYNTTVANSAGSGIANNTGNAANVVLYQVNSYFNNGNLFGATTGCTDPVCAQ